MTLIERWNEKARAEQQAAIPGQAAAGSQSQGQREYEACINALRLQYQITQSAVGYVKCRRTALAAGHYRTLERLCWEYVRQ